MSTRSGKRIHSSFHEDTAPPIVLEAAVKSERKTRSKRVKENLEELSVSLFKNKKRNNYVSYPTDDELLEDTTTKIDVEAKSSRVLRKNALKEQNPIKNEISEAQTEARTLKRKSRRVKKSPEDAEETENNENILAEFTEQPKSKQSKKKKNINTQIENLPSAEEAPAKKSKKKKKKGKKTSSLVIEEVQQNDVSKNGTFNRSNMSVDSFHSAAGSPSNNHDDMNKKHVNKLETTFEKIKNEEIVPSSFKTIKKLTKNNSFDKNDVSLSNNIEKNNDTFDKGSKRRKSVSKNTTFDKSNTSVTEDMIEEDVNSAINVSSFSNGQIRKTRSNTKDATYDKRGNNSETTLEKSDNEKIDTSFKAIKKLAQNNSFDKNNVSLSNNIEKNNDTFEKGSKRRKSVSKNTTFDKSNTSVTKDMIEEDVDSALNVSSLSNGQLSKRKSDAKDDTYDKNSITMTNVDKYSENNFNVSNVSNKKVKRRKSIKETKDVSLSENMSQSIDEVKNNTFDKVLKKTNSDTFNKYDLKEMVDAETDNVSNKQMRTRRSILQDTFDKSDVSMNIESVKNGDVDTNISNKRLRPRKSNIDSTFDKSNASIINENNLKKDGKIDLNESNICNKQLRRGRSSVKDNTFDKTEKLNLTFEKGTDSVPKEKVNKKDSTFDKSNNKSLNATYEKNIELDSSEIAKEREKSSINTSFDKTDKNNDTFEKYTSTSFDAFKHGALTRKSSISDGTFDKSNTSFASLVNEDFVKDGNLISSSAKKRKSVQETCDKNGTISENGNISYDIIITANEQRKSQRFSQQLYIQNILNTTFEKENEKDSLTSESKSSLISNASSSVSDKSDVSRISITSDDTTENIVNTTPVLIESSMDDSHVAKQESPKPHTPLKREGTFTKDGPEIEPEIQTPTKRNSLPVPPAGCTPYHVSKSSQKKSMLNVTRSLEKGSHPSFQPAPRLTKVMFCSPVDNPVTVTQEKRKIIKSNLKGSNKSFVFEESAALPRPARKRSYTQSDAENLRAKRSRLTDDLKQSVDRLSRPRTTSATGKLVITPAKKPTTPSKPKSEGKVARTKLPNFAAMHRKQFDKMESLDECQERKALRAKQLLTPTAPPGLLERISPKNNVDSPKAKDVQELVKAKEKTDTPTKKLPTLESLRPGFTRFGFKLNLDVNPFSIPSKTEKPKEKVIEKAVVAPPNPPRSVILPSLAGATSLRREAAKKTVMREKSFTDKRSENRTIIKGVRTNRRFELQMRMRNLD